MDNIWILLTISAIEMKHEILLKFIHVGFEVLTAVTMKSIVFYNVTACSLVEVPRLFGGMYCHNLQNQIVFCETIVTVYQSTRRHSSPHSQHADSLRSHTVRFISCINVSFCH
jgi:hypothetical protein